MSDGRSLLSLKFIELRQQQLAQLEQPRSGRPDGLETSFENEISGQNVSGKKRIYAYNHITDIGNGPSVTERGLIPGGLGRQGSGGQSSAGTFVSLPGSYVEGFSSQPINVPVFSSAKPQNDTYYERGVSGIFPLGTRPLRDAAPGHDNDSGAYSAQFPFTPRTAHGAKALYQNNGHSSVSSSPQAEAKLKAEYDSAFPGITG